MTTDIIRRIIPDSQRWYYAFRVREWFLARKDWDRVYEVGDSRDVVVQFVMVGDDDTAAWTHLEESARADDLALTDVTLVSKVNWGEVLERTKKT